MGHAQEAGEGVITSVGPGGGVALEVACLAVVVAQVAVVNLEAVAAVGRYLTS